MFETTPRLERALKHVMFFVGVVVGFIIIGDILLVLYGVISPLTK